MDNMAIMFQDIRVTSWVPQLCGEVRIIHQCVIRWGTHHTSLSLCREVRIIHHSCCDVRNASYITLVMPRGTHHTSISLYRVLSIIHHSRYGVRNASYMTRLSRGDGPDGDHRATPHICSNVYKLTKPVHDLQRVAASFVLVKYVCRVTEHISWPS